MQDGAQGGFWAGIVSESKETDASLASRFPPTLHLQHCFCLTGIFLIMALGLLFVCLLELGAPTVFLKQVACILWLPTDPLREQFSH